MTQNTVWKRGVKPASCDGLKPGNDLRAVNKRTMFFGTRDKTCEPCGGSVLRQDRCIMREEDG